MEPIDIDNLMLNLPGNDEYLPIGDIEILAEKINEIVEWINSKAD